MPLYDYSCENDHSTESRQGIDVESIPCPVCGVVAVRAGVYRQQFIQAETGPVGGKRNEVPPADQNLHQSYTEYREASEEVAYHYAKAEQETGKEVKAPDYWKQAKRKARKKDPAIR